LNPFWQCGAERLGNVLDKGPESPSLDGRRWSINAQTLEQDQNYSRSSLEFVIEFWNISGKFPDMKEDLTQVMQTIAQLASATASALSRGDAEEAFRLQRETDLVWQRARRLGQQQSRRPALSKAPSMRERAIAAVMELGVPAAPKLIAAYSEALTADAFDLRAIASIRRDEQRSWTSGARRETYLVPALEGPWFVAARGRFALSQWPLWQRIIGPLSPRVDHLSVCLHLCDRVEAGGLPASQRMRALLAEYARSVPGAVENPWESEERVDATRVRESIVAELNQIRVEDESSRKREAERAMRSLDEVQQIWGGAVPRVVAGKPS
jgi:hypothetical protein